MILEKRDLNTRTSGSRFLAIGTTLLILALSCVIAYGKRLDSISKSKISLNRISGFVYDQNRSPVIKVFVELQDELNRTMSRTRTDTTGRYVFSGMSDGTFFVHVIPTGTDLQERSIRVQVVNLGPANGSGGGRSDDVTQDFYLRPKKRASDASYQNKPGVIFVQDIPKAAKIAYQKAELELKRKNSSKGIKFLNKAIESFPRYFIALNRLGYLYFEMENYALASENFAVAADVNPKSEPTLYLLAYSVFLTKRYDAAITILRGALGYQHETSRIYLLLGKSLRANKKFDVAEMALKQAERLNKSKDAEVNWELAKLYGTNLKKYGEAAAQLEIFLKRQPDSRDKKQILKLIQKFKEKDNGK